MRTAARAPKKVKAYEQMSPMNLSKLYCPDGPFVENGIFEAIWQQAPDFGGRLS